MSGLGGMANTDRTGRAKRIEEKGEGAIGGAITGEGATGGAITGGGATGKEKQKRSAEEKEPSLGAGKEGVLKHMWSLYNYTYINIHSTN